MSQRSIIIFVLLSVAVFTALAIYGDAKELFHSILLVSPLIWVGAILLTMLHVVARIARWHYYLRVVGIQTDLKTTSLVFLAGLGMIMIPGRIGELAKSLFLKQKANVQIRESAPVVVTERIMDVLSVLFLGIWSLIFIPYGWVIIVVSFVGIATLSVIVASPKGVAFIVKLPVIRRWAIILTDSGQNFRKLFTVKVLTIGFLLGSFAWFLNGLSFWLVLQGFHAEVTLPAAVSIFSASSLIGSITMLPGGLISTEGSLLAMLFRVGLGTTTATAAILVIRITTLWFAVIVGFIGLMILGKHRATVQDSEDVTVERSPETASMGGFLRGSASQSTATSTGADS